MPSRTISLELGTLERLEVLNDDPGASSLRVPFLKHAAAMVGVPVDGTKAQLVLNITRKLKSSLRSSYSPGSPDSATPAVLVALQRERMLRSVYTVPKLYRLSRNMFSSPPPGVREFRLYVFGRGIHTTLDLLELRRAADEKINNRLRSRCGRPSGEGCTNPPAQKCPHKKCSRCCPGCPRHLKSTRA